MRAASQVFLRLAGLAIMETGSASLLQVGSSSRLSRAIGNLKAEAQRRTKYILRLCVDIGGWLIPLICFA